MTKKKLSDQINDWLRWESHSKTPADEAKKCGSNVTNDDTVRGVRQVRSCKPWLVWSQALSRSQASLGQPCEFSEMLAALQNDISSLPREWNVWDWNLTVHIVSLSAPNFISPTWIEIQFSSREMIVMVMTVSLRSGEWGPGLLSSDCRLL